MTIEHQGDHEADVRQILGVKAAGDSKLAGIEIETGWSSEAKRSAFLKGLEKRGWGDKCISKHDGTIGGGLLGRTGTIPAEIVSVPMPFDQLRKFAIAVGEELEDRADKGLITSGCGVHIHVSEGLFDPDSLWRFAASIGVSQDHIISWLNRPDKPVVHTEQQYAEFQAVSTEINRFWDDICLRGQTNYSQRLPYDTVTQIPTTKDHKRAFIHGKNSPTFETRIFRTPKSRRVLASYVDAVQSLHQFSLAVGLERLLEDPKKTSADEIARIRKETYPALYRGADRQGQTVFYNTETGEQFDNKEVDYVVSQSRSYENFYPLPSILLRMGKRTITPAEMDLLYEGEAGTGARGWVEGAVPLREYLTYVMNSGLYPDLAKRLGFSKFSPYINVREAPDPRANEASHIEFKAGCHVRVENGKGEVWTLISETQKTKDGIPNWTLDCMGKRMNMPNNMFIHCCKGAEEVGGEV